MRRWPRARALVALAAVIAAALGLRACVDAESMPTTENATRLLVDREEVFPAVLALIRGAEREVLLSMYLLGGSEEPPGAFNGIGREIALALAERQAAGVRVRVINTRFVEVEDLRPAATIGEDDPWFHPVFDQAVALGLPIVRPATASGAIDHTKYVVVDGREAIFGGMNLGDALASNHDAMIHVVGPAAADLQRIFEASWRDAVARHGAPAAALDGPVVEIADEEAQAAAREDRLADAGWERCALDLRRTGTGAAEILAELRGILADAAPGDALDVSLLLLSDASLVDALIDAHRRGVGVRVTLDPNEAFYGVDCEGSNNAAAIARLADAGVPVRHYAVARGQELHLKSFVLTRPDGARVFAVGSANWTGSDMRRNREVSGFFSGCPGVAGRLHGVLDDDWRARTRELSPELLARFRDPAERERLAAACGERLRTISWLRGRR